MRCISPKGIEIPSTTPANEDRPLGILGHHGTWSSGGLQSLNNLLRKASGSVGYSETFQAVILQLLPKGKKNHWIHQHPE